MASIEKIELCEKLEEYIKDLESNPDAETELHESDIAELLTDIQKKDKEKYNEYIKKLPPEMLGDVFLELPDKFQDELSDSLSSKELAEIVDELETDDATDIIQKIEENDIQKAKDVLSQIETEHKEQVEILKQYEEDEVGSYMQVELFSAQTNETVLDVLKRLKKLKDNEEIEQIHYIYIIDDKNKLKGMVSLEDLITEDFSKTFSEYDNLMLETATINSTDDIKDAAKIVEKYDLTVVPVVDKFNHLIGRITPDDMYDIIEENATDQMYGLANVDKEEEIDDDVFETGKTRGFWLMINLITAITASLVIGLFSDTINQMVALAVLMPIVASMGGIAGTQTLTVVVRELALGEVDFDDTKEIIKKEILVALFNGMIFSLATAFLAYIWFDQIMLGAVMAGAILINLVFAGLFGAGIPLLLEKLNIDPAVASGVILTTITDVVGFFSFLGLATLVLF